MNERNNLNEFENIKDEAKKFEKRDFADLQNRIAAQKEAGPLYTPLSAPKKSSAWKAGLITAVASLVLIFGFVGMIMSKNVRDELASAQKPYYEAYKAITSENKGTVNFFRTDTVEETAEDASYALASSAPEAKGYGDYSGDTTGNSGYGKTNTQIEDVDEADFVKNDGKNLYVLSTYQTANREPRCTLSIIDAKTNELVSQTDIEVANFYDISEMYLVDDKLVIVTTLTEGNYISDLLRSDSLDETRTTLRVYDIADGGKTVNFARDYTQEGQYVSSRLVGENVYLITVKYVYRYGSIDIDDMPRLVPHICVREGGTAEAYIEEDMVKAVPEENIYVFNDERASDFITVSAFSVSSGDYNTQTVLAESSAQAFSNSSNLYTATYSYSGEETEIAHFEINGTSIEHVATGSVPGDIYSQFSMDEKDGNLRIATTENNEANNWEPVNRLYVLDRDMNIIGTSDELAKGEMIKSVRFMGDMAYVVTFRQTDPLFAIDVSDPTSPKVLGELKIPGFSTYMHPLDENTLIGVGFDADEETGWQTGLKFSLFDISDPANLVEKDKLVVSGGAWSPATNDHRAVTYIEKDGLLLVPYDFYDEYIIIGEKKITSQYSNGVLVLNVSADSGFALKGIIVDPQENFHMSGDTSEQRQITRTTYVDDTIYTISHQSVMSVDMETLTLIKQTDLYETETIIYETPEPELTPGPEPTPDPNQYEDILPFEGESIPVG